MIASSAKIYSNVEIGQNVTIEDYCIIGVPPMGCADGALKTVIGDNAHIRSHTVIYAGNVIGDNFVSGNKVNIREKNTIGDNVSIGTLSVIEHSVKIGSKTRIHSQVFVPEYSVMEEGVWIGPNVVITNAKYPNNAHTKKNLNGVLLKSGAKIGANSTILPGVTVGKNALVGAASTVTRSVDQDTVVFGSPAQVTGTLSEIDDYAD